jgi:hypothetical protein
MSTYTKRTERSHSNQWPNALSQTPRKTRACKSQNKLKERNNKLRAEINEIETKKSYKESMKQNVGSLKK